MIEWKRLGSSSGTFPRRMSTIKDKNGRTQQKQKRLRTVGKNTQKTEGQYKKCHNDPGNHNGAVTHLELDILECEVNWALGSIPMNKASSDDKIPAEQFKNPKR